MTIGERIRTSRYKKAMSRAELSRKSGIAQSFICELEGNQVRLNGSETEAHNIISLARALEVDLLWLKTGWDLFELDDELLSERHGILN